MADKETEIANVNRQHGVMVFRPTQKCRRWHIHDAHAMQGRGFSFSGRSWREAHDAYLLSRTAREARANWLELN